MVFVAQSCLKGVCLMALLLVIVASVLMHTAPPDAYANGRVVEFDRRIAGQYELAFGKIPGSPVVGNLYLSIIVTDTESKAPVMGANVVVTAIGPNADEVEIGPITVNPDPDSLNYPGYYDTTEAIVVDREGIWHFTVAVEDAAGSKGEAEFLVEVTTPNPITGIITLVALLAFVVVIALAVRMFFKERRRSRLS